MISLPPTDQGLTADAMRFLAPFFLTILARGTHARRANLQEATAPSTAAEVSEYAWHVTVGSRAPDCFQRDVILVNGDFQPALEVNQGDYLKVHGVFTFSRRCCSCLLQQLWLQHRYDGAISRRYARAGCIRTDLASFPSHHFKPGYCSHCSKCSSESAQTSSTSGSHQMPLHEN